MDRKLEIAIVYRKTQNWIGGTYYIQNLIFALKQLDDKIRPIINVYTDSHDIFEELKQLTCYDSMYFHFYRFKRPLIYRIINRLYYKVCPLSYKALGALNIKNTNNEIIYPVSHRTLMSHNDKSLAWIPDFQERYLPHFFSSQELKDRKTQHLNFIKYNIPIVFSSSSAEFDFHKFYPNAKNKTYVLRFAVTHPDFSTISIKGLLKKYGIQENYYFCANQFWEHKNHLVLFKAVRKLKELGKEIQIVCSGALHAYKNESYPRMIQDYLAKYNLEDNVKILGFINRDEQLCLMKNSIAIIQPSLFEGWSTVVEDAKCLNKHIILSDIPVHKEQAPVNVDYFIPENVDQLVTILNGFNPSHIQIDYSECVKQFGEDFIHIVYDVTRGK